MEKILVTGSSGFIGMHLCESLLNEDFLVLGIDNMNNYYDVRLKMFRKKKLEQFKNFKFENIDICDLSLLRKVIKNFKPNKIVNLAAQAGVRYSLENPHAYIDSNIVGFMNILEMCRFNDVKGLVYASSSSVYGGNEKVPFSIKDRVDKPISIYAASKKANELMAHTYSHLYGLNTTGLRFFTVYGPWGRPDMAMYIFAENIIKNKPIPVFNYGKMKRDFTYISDIVDGIRKALDKNYQCEIFNLGNNKTEDLFDMIKIIEQSLDKKATIDLMEIQPGDVEKTFADINHSNDLLGYMPAVEIKEGIPKFIKWFKSYKLDRI